MKNPNLRRNVLCGNVPPDRIAKMTAEVREQNDQIYLAFSKEMSEPVLRAVLALFHRKALVVIAWAEFTLPAQVACELSWDGLESSPSRVLWRFFCDSYCQKLILLKLCSKCAMHLAEFSESFCWKMT